jgi:hypothetical protein
VISRTAFEPRRARAGGRNPGPDPGCGLGAGALASARGKRPWAALCWAGAIYRPKKFFAAARNKKRSRRKLGRAGPFSSARAQRPRANYLLGQKWHEIKVFRFFFYYFPEAIIDAYFDHFRFKFDANFWANLIQRYYLFRQQLSD